MVSALPGQGVGVAVGASPRWVWGPLSGCGGGVSGGARGSSRILALVNHEAVADRPFGRSARTEHPDRTEHFTMSDDATFERLRDIISNTLKVDREKVTIEASFNDDLKADSLDLVELIMAFEEEYGVEIPDEEARNITTVGAALAYVKAHGTH